MYRYNGSILKTLHISDDRWIDIVSRVDGCFRFYERAPNSDLGVPVVHFESPSYISAAAAEAAARLKFKL